MKPFFLLLLFIFESGLSDPECKENTDCQKLWPGSTCRRSKCICPENYLKRKSDSRGWVCLSLLDASTSMIGPPLTCPLPDGAGFRVLLKNENNTAILCDSEKKPCPKHYECIQTIGEFSPEFNGVCCPRKEVSCSPDDRVDLDQDGWLARWFFDGSECRSFMWNPNLAHSPNTFSTKDHCESYCMS